MNQGCQNEIELILRCACLNPDRRDIDQIKHLSAREMNWTFIKETVLRNRICPIVLKNFMRIQENIPPDIFSQLKKQTLFTGGRSLILGTHLQHMIRVFNEQDIFVLPFKGPVLSGQVYQDNLVRFFSDLDILVARSDVVRAFHLLEKKGFSPQLSLNRAQFAKYIDDEDHFAFYDRKKRVLIELHWDMAGLYLSRRITLEDLNPHLRDGHLHHTPISCLSMEALLVYLCVHGAKHGWQYLEQICSVSELIRSTPDLDWESVIQISSEWRCRRMLKLGLHLGHTLLKAPIPHFLQADISTDKLIFKATEKIMGHLFFKQTGAEFSDRFSSFHIQIRDSFPDKVRYFLRLVFRPTDMEWQVFPVPGVLSFVHCFTRPCRLAYARLKGC
jgi:hypothetical protein